MTLFASFGESRVTAARILLPAWGAAVGDVQIAEDDPILDTALLTIADFSQVMTVQRTGPYGGSRGARLIAGAAGWRKTVRRQFYGDANGVKLAAILGDAAGLVGETVVLASAFASRLVGFYWNREEAPASRVLALTVGTSWYVDPLGVTQVGERVASTVGTDFEVTSARPELGLYTIGTEDLVPWRPGVMFVKPPIVPLPLAVSSVSIVMTGNKLRLEVMADP